MYTYTTEFNGKQYAFSDDQVTVNGIPIPYSEMTEIAHRGGDAPAFLFTYKGRRFALPHREEDLKAILPYFVKAQQSASANLPLENAVPIQPAASTAPAAEEPGAYAAPGAPEQESFTVSEETEQEVYAAPGVEPESFAAPAATEPEAYVEPGVESEAFVAPEASEQGAYATPGAPEQETFTVPEVQEPEAYAAPEDEQTAYIEPGAPEQEVYDAPDDEQEIYAEAEGQDPFAAPDDAGLSAGLASEPEQPKKGFWTKGKLIIAAVVLVAIVVALVFAFHGKGDSATPSAGHDISEMEGDVDGAEDFEDDEELEPEPLPTETLEATDGFTVTDMDGTIDAVLKKVYVGDDALNKLSELGENQSDFTEDSEPGYKLVMYEYDLKVKDGKLIGDPITGEAYLPDKATEMDDYWEYSLEANPDKDLSMGELELNAGESATVYIVYEMPEKLNDYYEKVYVDTEDNTVWVHYVLK